MPARPDSTDLAARLDAIAHRLNHTNFSNADPGRWHEERNAAVVQLRREARRLRGEPEKPDHTWRAPAPAGLRRRLERP